MVSAVKTWVTSDNLLFSDLNAEFANVYSALNGGVSTLIGTGAVTITNLADNASPAVYFAELFQDGAVIGTTGFAHVSSSGLDETIAGGTIYVLQTSSTPDKLFRIDIAGNTTHTVLDNTTNFLDMGSDGVIDVTQSAVPATDHARLLKAIATGGVITPTPTDEADRDFLGDTIGDFKPRRLEWACTAVTTATISINSRFRDTTNTKTFEFKSAQTVDITASGANGLDQGSEASSTWYALVGIGDSSGINDTKGLLVTAANYSSSMTLPSGYDLFARIGWLRNDGSSNLVQGRYYHDHFYYEDAPAAGAFTDVAFATKSFAVQVPPTVRETFVNSSFSGAGNQSFTWRETGSSAATGTKYYDSNGGAGGNTWFILDTSQQVDLKTGGGTQNVLVTMYRDDLQEDE